VIHLDRYFWSTGWVEPDRDSWREQVKELLKGESWIIDGNYGATMDMRLDHCDTVIFLDFPRHVCTWRVLKRSIAYRGRTRPDLADGCPEKLDFDFIKWTWNYPVRSRPHVLERLSRVEDKVKIITFTNSRQVNKFLMSDLNFAS
jgi:adenylate kinase family enzyme